MSLTTKIFTNTIRRFNVNNGRDSGRLICVMQDCIRTTDKTSSPGYNKSNNFWHATRPIFDEIMIRWLMITDYWLMINEYMYWLLIKWKSGVLEIVRFILSVRDRNYSAFPNSLILIPDVPSPGNISIRNTFGFWCFCD